MTSNSPYIEEAVEAGAKTHADQFDHPFQIRALKKGVNEVDALKFSQYQQIRALELGVEPELALNFTNLSLQALVLGVPAEYTFLFSFYSLMALRAGASVQEALCFKTGSQVNLFRNGASFEQIFIEEETKKFIKEKAIEAGASEEIASNCTKLIHVRALEAGIPPEEVVYNNAQSITDFYKEKGFFGDKTDLPFYFRDALSAGATVEQAKNFKEVTQIRSFDFFAAPYDLALKFTLKNSKNLTSLEAGLPAEVALTDIGEYTMQDIMRISKAYLGEQLVIYDTCQGAQDLTKFDCMGCSSPLNSLNN